MQTYRLDIKPISKPRMTQRDKWAKRKCVVEYYEYKDILHEELESNINFKKYVNEVDKNGILKNLTFGLVVPKSLSKKQKGLYIGLPHQVKPDLDNLIKGFMDCLFEQDSFICKFNNIQKVWSKNYFIEFEV